MQPRGREPRNKKAGTKDWEIGIKGRNQKTKNTESEIHGYTETSLLLSSLLCTESAAKRQLVPVRPLIARPAQVTRAS